MRFLMIINIKNAAIMRPMPQAKLSTKAHSTPHKTM